MSQTIQIQADWAQTDSTQIDFIKNKPNLYDEWWGTQAEYDAILVKDPDIIYNIIYEEPQINYFYVEDISGSDNTLSIAGNSASSPAIEVFKSTDGTNWASIGTTSTTAITATVPANGKLYLKATVTTWSTGGAGSRTSITVNGNHNIGGNIMSLLYGDDFEGKTTLPTGTNYTFYGLFQSDTTLISASNLNLAATTLSGDRPYEMMFRDCTNLTGIPALPATTLSSRCYCGMFWGCTSLTTLPALPVTTLTQECYNSMFQGCTALTSVPSDYLPAITLGRYCYQTMFRDCTSLTTAPALPATTLNEYCYAGMFRGCTSLTTAPVLNATTLARSCYNGMFKNCTSLTASPILLTATLTNNCYYEMFAGCKNIHTVTTYASDISASGCLDNWLYSVSATGDFYNLGGATYETGASGIPSGWTEHTSL